MRQSCWVMAIIDVFSRRFVGFAVERGDVDGPVVCRMFNRARESSLCRNICPPTTTRCSDSITG
jgi:transposase InsO family protein